MLPIGGEVGAAEVTGGRGNRRFEAKRDYPNTFDAVTT